MRYSELIFTCQGGEGWEQDVFIADLADLGFDSFEDFDGGFRGYIPSEQLDFQSLETLLLHLPQGFKVSYEHHEIESQNWNAVWESNFEAITIKDQCYVRAAFHPAMPAYPYEIVIHPKMAFGTGHHQTTSLMLEYLLEDDFVGLSLLDMGCGTGILAIMASLRGALQVEAIDNDAVCVESTVENTQLNQVTNIVQKQGSIAEITGKQYHVILANINRNILLEHLSHYAQALLPEGRLYLSGFYDGEDRDLLDRAAKQHGLSPDGFKKKDNWVAARYRKLE